MWRLYGNSVLKWISWSGLSTCCAFQQKSHARKIQFYLRLPRRADRWWSAFQVRYRGLLQITAILQRDFATKITRVILSLVPKSVYVLISVFLPYGISERPCFSEDFMGLLENCRKPEGRRTMQLFYTKSTFVSLRFICTALLTRWWLEINTQWKRSGGCD